MKTIAVISDTHCGSSYGLTPPMFYETKMSKRLRYQREAWEAYREISRRWYQPDILIVNGDLIEGTQSKQGGAELITPDRLVQCNMAVKCIEEWDAKRVFITYGTKYHTGEQAEDFEYGIAEILKTKGIPTTIEGRLYLNVEGVIFDIRHKVGTSSIPHGRATALMKEMMWDLIDEAKETGPKVHVVIRSHAHYHIWVEDTDKTMFITPGLQLKRGRYGSRECQGEIHWGAIRLTVDKGQITNKEKSIWKLAANRPRVFSVK